MPYNSENISLYFAGFPHRTTAAELSKLLEKAHPSEEPILETRIVEPSNQHCYVAIIQPNGLPRIGEVYGWAHQQVLVRTNPEIEYGDPKKIPQTFIIKDDEVIRYGIVDDMLPLTETDFSELLKLIKPK